VPRGVRTERILGRLSRYLPLVPGAWISTGFAFGPSSTEEERELYKRYRRLMGLFAATNYHQRQVKQAENFRTAIEMVKNFREFGRRKPERVIVRLHWNHMDKQPERLK
jgi:hypothetical protein